MVALSNGTTSARASGQQPHQQFAVLFHGMAAELKTSNSAWEGVCSRATKLASQLNSTAGALGHFVDALQTVSDSANNVNGISRDIGAALTRFCIRQRSIEAALRLLGQSLQSQFAVDLERKCADWRLSLSDAERRHQRTCKRLKSKQKQMEAESRNSFVELLHAQRNQFTGFTGVLLPIINLQLALLDEGAHVRQVRDSMETALNENDAHSLVQALLEDIDCCPGPSSLKTAKQAGSDRTAEEQRAWDQRVRIGLASSRAKSASQLRLCPSLANGLDQQSTAAEDTYSQHYGALGGFATDNNNYDSHNNHRNSMPPPSTAGQTAQQQQHQFWSPPTPSGFYAAGDSSPISHSFQMLDHNQQRLSLNSSSIGGGTIHSMSTVANGAPPPPPAIAPMPIPMRHRPPLPEAFIVASSSTVKSAQNSPKKQQQRRPTLLLDGAASYSASLQFRPASNFAGCSAPGSAGCATNSMASSSCSVQTMDSNFSAPAATAALPPPPPPPLPPSHGNGASSRPAPGQQQQQQQQFYQRPLSLGATAVAAIESVDGSATTTSSSSAALIAETLQQIDRLGLELDSYCNGLDTTGHGGQQRGRRHPPPPPLVYANNSATTSSGGVRFRPDSLLGTQPIRRQQPPMVPPPPPLPERRNSAISSATPTAPSIADIRGAASIAGGNRCQQPQPPTPFFYGGLQPVRQAPAPPTFRHHPATPMAPMPSFCPPNQNLQQNQQQQVHNQQQRFLRNAQQQHQNGE